MIKMSIEIGWKQSKEVRINIMSLMKDMIKEMKKLMKLQNELLQMQIAGTKVITLSNMEIEVNEDTIYEKQEAIKECESNISDNLYTMEIAMLDDSDLTFMAITETETKVTECENDVDNCINEIDELKGEMEE